MSEAKAARTDFQYYANNPDSFNLVGNRVCIFGRTGSGKTTLAVNKIKQERKKIDMLIILTRKHNNEYYEKQFSKIVEIPKRGIFGNVMEKEFRRIVNFQIYNPETVGTDGITQVLKKLPKFQEVMLEKEGRKKEILVLVDDILDRRFVRDDVMADLFCVYRHHKVSSVFLIQTMTNYISPIMKGNCQYFVFFAMSLPETKHEIAKMMAIYSDVYTKNADYKNKQQALELYEQETKKNFGHGFIVVPI